MIFLHVAIKLTIEANHYRRVSLSESTTMLRSCCRNLLTFCRVLCRHRVEEILASLGRRRRRDGGLLGVFFLLLERSDRFHAVVVVVVLAELQMQRKQGGCKCPSGVG